MQACLKVFLVFCRSVVLHLSNMLVVRLVEIRECPTSVVQNMCVVEVSANWTFTMSYKVVDGCICRHLHLHCSDVEKLCEANGS